MTDAPKTVIVQPCPFCGSNKVNVERDHNGDGVFAFIACGNCRAKSRETYYSNGNDCPQTYQGLRDAWNKRTLASTVAAQLKAADELEKSVWSDMV